MGIIQQFGGEELSNASSFLTAEQLSELGDLSTASFNIDHAGRLLMFKYIDDTTTVEIIDKNYTEKQFTTATTLENAIPVMTDNIMRSFVRRTEEIGMVINGKKTQAVCISGSNGCKTTSALHVAGAQVKSEDCIKLLGFMIGSRPGVHDQVAYMKKKFRKRFWSLIQLKRAGMKGGSLFKMFCIFVRPVLETYCVIFHPMLTKQQARDIERMQKAAVKPCFGFDRSYAEVCAEQNIQSLSARRERLILRFVTKTLNNDRFASD